MYYASYDESELRVGANDIPGRKFDNKYIVLI